MEHIVYKKSTFMVWIPVPTNVSACAERFRLYIACIRYNTRYTHPRAHHKNNNHNNVRHRTVPVFVRTYRYAYICDARVILRKTAIMEHFMPCILLHFCVQSRNERTMTGGEGCRFWRVLHTIRPEEKVTDDGKEQGRRSCGANVSACEYHKTIRP